MQGSDPDGERSTLNESDLGLLLAEPRIPGLRRLKTLDQSEISKMDQETSTSSVQEDQGLRPAPKPLIVRRSAVSKLGYACRYLALLLAWLVAAVALLLVDEHLCYVSGKYHKIVLNRTQTAVDPAPETLLSPGTWPSAYNRASDVVLDGEIDWAGDGENSPETFPLGVLVNETTYRSASGQYVSELDTLTLETP